jgi:hypothetical protein
VLAASAALSISAADAKSARCFTTDDGYFPCDFSTTDNDGSFQIMGSDGTGFSMVMDQPGFGYGYLIDGEKSVPLAGEYVRSRDDGACWNNPETNDKVCAW